MQPSLDDILRQLKRLEQKVADLSTAQGLKISGRTGLTIGRTKLLVGANGHLYQRETDGVETDLSASGSGMAQHANEYHTPDMEEAGVAATLDAAHVAAADPDDAPPL